MYRGRISPWKMCPPVSPTRRSMSGGPSTSSAMIARGQVAAEAGDRADHRPPDLVAPGVPVPSRNRCGTYCAKTLSVCTPARRDARVEHGLQVQLVPGARRQVALVGQPVEVAPLLLGERRVHLARCGAARGCPGRAVKFGQLGERHVDLDRDALRSGSPAPASRPCRVGAAAEQRRASRADRRWRPRRGARIRSPDPSSTPSPGTIRATGTPAATVAPASRAMSHSRNDTIPIPPSTYPQVPGMPVHPARTRGETRPTPCPDRAGWRWCR